MVNLVEYQLKTALVNVESVKQFIDNQREVVGADVLDDYHYELLDIELRLKDLLAHLGNVEDCL